MSGRIFGPVPSRRLGRSLGVDLVPFKTCTFDCIYCQLGRTTRKVVRRREWVPLQLILHELEQKLDSRPDYITLSGSGEPTLYGPLDELVAGIRALTDIPIAVLTNGSLLGDEQVQRGLRDVDLVIPSLDAGDDAVFRLVNRPHGSLTFERVLAGLAAFRRAFHNQIWLEVFLLRGYTSLTCEIAEIRRCIDSIEPDRVQLNTVTRPPCEDYALAVPRWRLEEIAAEFNRPVEVIADYQTDRATAIECVDPEEILQLLRRRPCSLDDIAHGLGLHRNEVLKSVEHLESSGLVARSLLGEKLYFTLPRRSPAAASELLAETPTTSKLPDLTGSA